MTPMLQTQKGDVTRLNPLIGRMDNPFALSKGYLRKPYDPSTRCS